MNNLWRYIVVLNFVREAFVIRYWISFYVLMVFVILVQHEIDGKTYYTFEFMAKAPNYTRHALSTIAVNNGTALCSILNTKFCINYFLHVYIALQAAVGWFLFHNLHCWLQVNSTHWRQEPTKGGGGRWKINYTPLLIPSNFSKSMKAIWVRRTSFCIIPKQGHTLDHTKYVHIRHLLF